MTENPDVFYKKFDALTALDPNTQFISKNFEVVNWVGRLVERFCSLFSSDERYSSKKYDYQEVAKNINQFIKDYYRSFGIQASNAQGSPKVEKIISNLLVLQKRFAHGKDEEQAKAVKKVFNSSITDLIKLYPSA